MCHFGLIHTIHCVIYYLFEDGVKSVLIHKSGVNFVLEKENSNINPQIHGFALHEIRH